MNTVILTKTYDAPLFDRNEILRYAGCRDANSQILLLLENCIKEVQDKLTYKVCYRKLSVTVDKDVCDFKAFKVVSKKLAENLKNCENVLLFAATIGIEIDRLIAKYSRISPSKALMFQALGAERIEKLCNAFCNDSEREMDVTLKARFSPGYGDLQLSVQKDIFGVLDCSRLIGLSLNDSLIMSPSKSVTAFVGVSDNKEKIK